MIKKFGSGNGIKKLRNGREVMQGALTRHSDSKEDMRCAVLGWHKTGGVGSGSSVIGSNAFSGKGPSGVGGLNVVEARLEFAHDYLAIALALAESKASDGKLHPQTITRLLSRHAGILERMGSQASWFESRSQLERVWAGLPGQGMEAARTALKLGDLNHRLGDAEDALAWWARALQLTQTREKQDVSNLLSIVPDSVPEASPSAQRTMISALVSLSAFLRDIWAAEASKSSGGIITRPLAVHHPSKVNKINFSATCASCNVLTPPFVASIHPFGRSTICSSVFNRCFERMVE